MRICETCGQSYAPKHRRQRFCSVKCVGLYTAKCMKERGQVGLNHPHARLGTNLWRKIAEVTPDTVCAWCAWPKNIVVHHLDGDEGNNDRANLAPICKSCHQKYHRAGWWLLDRQGATNAGKGHHPPPRPGQPGTPEFPEQERWSRLAPTLYAQPSRLNKSKGVTGARLRP